MNISVLGDGGWGTAIALLLNSYGHKVILWGPFEDYIDEMRRSRENSRFLPGVTLPEDIVLESDPRKVTRKTDLYVLASPSKFLASVCKQFTGLIPPDARVVSLTKGLSEDSDKRMSEVAQSILGTRSIAVLSGPTHAEEVARRIPTAIVVASENPGLASDIQSIFTGPSFRVYTSTDPAGVEIGGAVKNVIAIAVGASDGLGFGDNTRAALITRGLTEIQRFGEALGARRETFTGLSGIGDLIVTCTSKHSRNHSVGERLGKGEKIKDILSSMEMVAEGVWNAKVIHDLSHKLGIEMPIAEVVYSVCYEECPVRKAVETLMSRTTKSEM